MTGLDELKNKLPLNPVSLLITSATTWTTTRALGFPYRELTGSWWLRFIIVGVSGNFVSYTITIAGVVWKVGWTQSLNCSNTTKSESHLIAPNDIIVANDIASTVGRIDGDIELESKPDFA